MNEKSIRTRCLLYLNSLPQSDFEVSPPGSNTGKPDITGCLAGRYIAVETKRPKSGRLSKAQKYVHKRLRAAGALVIVATSVEQVRNVVESLT